jgi:hypothetical protein
MAIQRVTLELGFPDNSLFQFRADGQYLVSSRIFSPYLDLGELKVRVAELDFPVLFPVCWFWGQRRFR